MSKWADLDRWPGWFIGILVMVGYLGLAWVLSGPAPRCRVVTHTITAQCVSASDMARAYVWDGDRNEYRHKLQRLNGWENGWPRLHAGQRIRVADYRRSQ